jgi:hypothetical protein
MQQKAIGHSIMIEAKAAEIGKQIGEGQLISLGTLQETQKTLTE